MRAGAALIFCIYMKRENINKKSSYTIRAATTPYKNVSIPRELTLHSKRAPAKKKKQINSRILTVFKGNRKRMLWCYFIEYYIYRKISVWSRRCVTHTNTQMENVIFSFQFISISSTLSHKYYEYAFSRHMRVQCLGEACASAQHMPQIKQDIHTHTHINDDVEKWIFLLHKVNRNFSCLNSYMLHMFFYIHASY